MVSDIQLYYSQLKLASQKLKGHGCSTPQRGATTSVSFSAWIQWKLVETEESLRRNPDFRGTTDLHLDLIK